jgi:hypothetical protein
MLQEDCYINSHELTENSQILDYIRRKAIKKTLFKKLFRKSFEYAKDYINQSNKTKQKRPKRGKYRKYETNQLNKAVDAVMTGGISVHKASCYFGVPHSTLEYKVKERTKNTNSCDLFNRKTY